MTISKQDIVERLRLGQTVELNFPDFAWLLFGLEKLPELDAFKFNVKIKYDKITLSPVKKYSFPHAAKLVFAGISLNILYRILWKNRRSGK